MNIVVLAFIEILTIVAYLSLRFFIFSWIESGQYNSKLNSNTPFPGDWALLSLEIILRNPETARYIKPQLDELLRMRERSEVYRH